MCKPIRTQWLTDYLAARDMGLNVLDAIEAADLMKQLRGMV